jgi:hypothetical protein
MRASKAADDLVLSTMLGAWLTELIYMNENTATAPIQIYRLPCQQWFANRRKTILRILSSDDVSAVECADYAAISGDIGTAVQTALGKDGAAYEALRILNDAALHIAEPYYYRYASVLLARSPLAASKSFLSRVFARSRSHEITALVHGLRTKATGIPYLREIERTTCRSASNGNGGS